MKEFTIQGQRVAETLCNIYTTCFEGPQLIDSTDLSCKISFVAALVKLALSLVLILAEIAESLNF